MSPALKKKVVLALKKDTAANPLKISPKLHAELDDHFGAMKHKKGPVTSEGKTNMFLGETERVIRKKKAVKKGKGSGSAGKKKVKGKGSGSAGKKTRGRK